MYYRDLIQYDPIESIIQLRDADKASAARNLVATYVFSDSMAVKLVDVAFPQIQIHLPADNKGILVVGNYGTGKSHLMALISALAEYPEAVADLSHPAVRQAAEQIAGKFKVARVEIGAVRRSLRDILLDELAQAFSRWGIEISFPPDDEITNNKGLIIDAVAKFTDRYPGQGVLLVVDEMLDYLSSRPQRELILDLGFLRELGEVCKSTAFRFVGGLQETLFGNPRFSFAAQQLNRVRDRFEQVNIARQDVAFVVANRLLRKTVEQRAWITDYLRQFAPFFGSLAERLNEFVDLFPVHPAYIETFDALTIAEKREVLKTLSAATGVLMNQEVPNDRPGLLSYDQYWRVIQEKPSLRAIEGIAETVEKSVVLEGVVRNSYPRADLQPMAFRIIHALSVHRLTTSGVNARLGLTAENLRDQLFLFRDLPAGRQNGDGLLDQVKMCLREIIRTVQGQFITYNAENGQYYLDLQKTVDFDEKIDERARTIDPEDLDLFFFDGLKQAFPDLPATTYVTNHSIWFYELPWTDHKVTRPGYLFFGPPDERTTAQPPRDFYIYFIPPFMTRNWQDASEPDEVVFRLTGLGSEFERLVRTYGGARLMERDSTEHRLVYAGKAENHLRSLLGWLREHLLEHLLVRYDGVEESVGAVLPRLTSTGSQSVQDVVRLVAAHLLASQFAERYPEYPVFHRIPQVVGEETRSQSAWEAIRFLAGRGRTNLSIAVLDGLEVLDEQANVRPARSRYARWLLETLTSRPDAQVVNRNEVIERVAGGVDRPVEKSARFRLEPEWVAVLLAVLAYNGEIVINMDGREDIDAGNLERILTTNIETAVDFRFYKRPRTVPVTIWTSIMEVLGLQPGLIRDPNSHDEAVRELQRFVEVELQAAVRLLDRLQSNLKLWNSPIFTDRFVFVSDCGTVVDSDAPSITLHAAEIIRSIQGYKTFLEDLRRFNTTGRLNNLRKTAVEVAEFADYCQVRRRAQGLVELVDALQATTSYLVGAQANLPLEHPWSERARQTQKRLLERVRTLGKADSPQPGSETVALQQELAALKKAYIDVYAELHRRLVLSINGDDQRTRLYDDPRLITLRELSRIDMLRQTGDLDGWQQAITGLRACREFHEGMLEDGPTCRCTLNPATRTVSASTADTLLRNLDDRLGTILRNWRSALRSNLTSEVASRSLTAMRPAERRPIDEFLAQTDEAETIPDGFVPAAVQALRGIQAVTLSLDTLAEAMRAGGMPCTREELIQRITYSIDAALRGKDPHHTRLTLEQ